MFGSTTLDVLIGLVLVYFLLAVLVSTLNEFVASWTNWRATNLEIGLRNLLDGHLFVDNDPARSQQPLIDLFYKHPLIVSLHTRRFFQAPGGESSKKPSYIPARLFRSALEDVLVPADPKAGPRSLRMLRESVDKLPPGGSKDALQALLSEAGDDLEQARASVEHWFDDSMERLTGWYKRQVQLVILGLSLVVALLLNADTLTITNTLAHNPETRAYVVAVAEQVAKQSPPPTKEAPAPSFDKVRSAIGDVQDLQLPVGWPKGWASFFAAFGTFEGGLTKLIGLLITAAAVSLGAPFWFDLLGKLVSLRQAIKPRKSDEATGTKVSA